jgi:hypothetical protein
LIFQVMVCDPEDRCFRAESEVCLHFLPSNRNLTWQQQPIGSDQHVLAGISSRTPLVI